MTQSINVGAALGAANTGLTIGYRILNLDGTTYTAFTTTNVVETGTAGTYLSTVAVNAPDAGGRIVWGPSGTDLVTAIIDPLPSSGLTATALANVNAEVDTALADYDGPTKAELDTAQAAIIADTGATETAITAAIAALNDLSAAQVNAEVDTALADYDGPTKAELDTAQAAIIADTGATETAITAAITALNDLSAAQVNAEVDTALADYDGPTKAELDTTQAAIIADTGATETAVLAAITALNNLSAAQVNAEVDQALADYDGPTKAELDTAQTAITAAIAALNDLSAAQVRAQIDAALAAAAGSSITIVSTVNGSIITVRQADTWRFTVAITGATLTSYEKVAFAVKANETQDDDRAALYVRDDTGLVRIGTAAPTSSGNGSLTVDSDTEFSVLIALTETANVRVRDGYHWYLKVWDTDTDPNEGYTLVEGEFNIVGWGIEATS